MPQPSTTVVIVSNLPVTAFVNAEVEVLDGPQETLQARIAAAVRHGMWRRAEGRHAEEYGDLNLEVNLPVVENRWQFETMPPIGRPSVIPPSKITMTYGLMPTPAVFDLAWGQAMGEARAFSFENSPRVGTVSLRKDELWEALLSAHEEAVNGEGDAASAAGTWCSDVLGTLGIEWI